MFSNQINFRELFSNPSSLLNNTRPNNGANNDSTGSQSNSQFALSQADYPDSQEFNSQLACSQTSLGHGSPGRRLYGRSLGNQQASSNARGQLLKMTSQQLQSNIARAKDRDERDMLNSLTVAIRETMTDVLMAVTMVKDNVESNTASASDNLGSSLRKIQETMQKQQDDMMKALELRDKHREEVTKLRKELAIKESLLVDAREESRTRGAEGGDDIKRQLQNLCQVEHQETRDKLTSVHQQLNKQLRDQELKQRKEQSDLFKETHNCKEELLKSHKNIVKEIQLKISSEIKHAQQTEKDEMRKLLKDVKECVRGIQKQQKEDTEKLFKKHVQQLQSTKAFQEADDSILLDHVKEVKDTSTHHKHDIMLAVEQKLQEFTAAQEITFRDILAETLGSELEKFTDVQTKHFTQVAEESSTRQTEQIADIRETFKDDVKQLLKTLPKTVLCERKQCVSNDSLSAAADQTHGTPEAWKTEKRYQLRDKTQQPVAKDADKNTEKGKDDTVSDEDEDGDHSVAKPCRPSPQPKRISQRLLSRAQTDGCLQNNKETAAASRTKVDGGLQDRREATVGAPSREDLGSMAAQLTTTIPAAKIPQSGHQGFIISPLVPSQKAWNAAIPKVTGGLQRLVTEHRPSPVAAILPFVRSMDRDLKNPVSCNVVEATSTQGRFQHNLPSRKQDDYDCLEDMDMEEEAEEEVEPVKKETKKKKVPTATLR